MQLYVLDRAKNTLATTSSFYNDKHHKELTAGASIFEFTIDKFDSAAQHMTTGNYLVFQDDRGRAWSFTILSYDETQTTKTVAAEDVSIELLNKAMDVWNTDQAYPFSYYFDLVAKGTPWKLGINQVADLSRKLVYTGRDTGLGRLLSVLKGFDNAECQFNIKVKQNSPVEFTVDVYKSIGTIQDNIQIVYNNELADIKKTESRAQFVTALAGVGGLVENQATTDPGLEKHIDFADIDYKDDNFISPKGDKFLRAVTANRTFNPGATTYIEDFYDYDTQNAQELLNRTLTQLKERSEPQYTYDADVKVIDPTLDIGDTVTIIDHDYNPALYLQARVATLDKSYTDPTQGTITFCNYRVLNSNLSDQLRAMQNIIDQLPTSESVKLINSNIIKIIATNEELKKQVALSFESANGKSRIWFSKSATAQDGDVAFIKNADGATEIWKFVEGTWKLDTGLATFDDVKKAASAAADAGSQAVIAGQQASAAGADAKSAGDFAASAASQSAIETAAARSTANSAADAASDAVTAAFGAGTTADQAKSAAAAAKADAASAQSDAADALAEATKSFNDAQNAISNATKAMDAAEQNRTTVTGLVTKVDDIAGTIQTLATTQSVDKLAGTVTTVENLAQFAADGLKLKADTTTVNQINGTVNDLKGELDVQADKIAATVTASDVTGMLNGYATQSWSQGQISAAKNEISASVETVKQAVDNMQIGGVNLAPATDSDWVKVSSGGWGVTNISNPIYEVKDGQTYTASFEIKNITRSVRLEFFAITAEGVRNGGITSGYFIGTGSSGIVSYTFTANLPDNTSYVLPDLAFTQSLNTVGSYEYRRFKIERGTKQTDWSPAPEDQATVDWTKSQLDITDKKIAAGITTVTTTLNNNIASATANMATTTWTNTQIDAAKTAINLSVEQSITTSENTLNSNIDNATKDMATQTWTKGQLSVTDASISASVQKLHDAVTGEITTATTDMATQTWTQGKLDLTDSTLTSQISSVEDGLTKQYTRLQQTLGDVQVTANNAVTQAQLTLLSNQFTSVIGDPDNLVIGGDFEDQRAYIGQASPYWSSNATIVDNGDKNQDTNKSNTVLQINGLVSGNQDVTSKNLVAVRQMEYNIELKIRWSSMDQLGQIVIYAFEYDVNKSLISPHLVIFDSAPHVWEIITGTYKPSSSAVKYMALDITYNGAKSTLPVWVDDIQMALATASQSQFTQLQSDINLRVKTGDLVSQIDVNAKRILLDGASTYITNTTHIDTGVIKTAMIADAAITNGKIANAAIDNAKIANAAINSAKIADLAVGSAQIADGAISSAKIGNAAITSAKIADASILDAKIVSLDGSKIVAHSITADQLDVNAIAVGLNAYGAGWQITPASIAFLPVGTTHATISLSGDMGITYGDFTTGEMLGYTYGTPYRINAGMDWFNGISTVLRYNGADYWSVLSEESDGTTRPRLTYSRRRMAELGVFQGWTFDDNTHFATIGAQDPDDNAQMHVVRTKIDGRWCTGFMANDFRAGIAFGDGGWLYLERDNKWIDFWNVVNKIGLA